MKKKKLLLLLAGVLLFSGCTQKKTSSSSVVSSQAVISLSSEEVSEEASSIEENSSEDTYHLYEPEITGYDNMINKPSLVVHNLNELTEVLDYYAFYYVDTFQFALADDYVYYTGTENNFDKEMNAAYWGEELVNGIMGMLHEKEGNIVTINYVHYERNTIKCDATSVNGNDISYQEGDYNSNLTFSSDSSSRQAVNVTDSQQLFYAVQHGYRVIPEENSAAEKMYTLAKNVLNKIISPDMGYLDKVYAIYDYIEHNCVYDYAALDTPDADNPSLLPDQYASPYMCYYVEGCLENKICVCDGYAKTMSLLCNMVGVNCVRDSGTSDKEWSTREVAGHAYTYVEYNDKWYLCCPTWGQNEMNGYTYTLSDFLMTSVDYSSSFNRYASINVPEGVDLASYKEDAERNNILTMRKERYESKTYTYNNKTYSCYINNAEDMTYIQNALGSEKGNYITVYTESKDVLSNMQSLINSDTYSMGYFTYSGMNSSKAYEILIYVK